VFYFLAFLQAEVSLATNPSLGLCSIIFLCLGADSWLEGFLVGGGPYLFGLRFKLYPFPREPKPPFILSNAEPPQIKTV
jgi:hypothetical protein